MNVCICFTNYSVLLWSLGQMASLPSTKQVMNVAVLGLVP